TYFQIAELPRDRKKYVPYGHTGHRAEWQDFKWPQPKEARTAARAYTAECDPVSSPRKRDDLADEDFGRAVVELLSVGQHFRHPRLLPRRLKRCGRLKIGREHYLIRWGRAVAR